MSTLIQSITKVQRLHVNRYITRYYNGSAAGTATTASTRWVQFGNFERTGYKNENWRYRASRHLDASSYFKKQGYDELQPYYIRGESLVVSPTNPSIRYDSSGFTVGSPLSANVVAPVDGALSDLALMRLKNKLQRHAGEYNAAVPLAELKDLRRTIMETARLTTEAILSYANLRKHLLAGRKPPRRRIIRTLQDAWLTYSFGLVPLVSDAQNALHAIDSYLKRQDHSVRLTGAADKSWVTTGGTVSGLEALNACPLSVNSTFEHYLGYRWIAAARFDVRSSNDYSWDSTFGFTQTRLPGLFYELTPFSWVLDYFTTMGDFLDDVFVLPPGSTYYIVRDTLYTRKSVDTPFYVPIRDPSLVFCKTSKMRPGKSTWVSSVRNVGYANLPRVGIHVKSTDIVGRNSVSKLLNLISILKPR